MKKNVILIGFMGCGKTSVGRKLSYRLRWTMIDTDKWIENKNGMTVSEIFKWLGEHAFRQMETDCLKTLLHEGLEGNVVSAGGGLPLRNENRELLRRLGTVVYLRVTAPTVRERLAGDTTRPLLAGENPEEKIRTLLEVRAPFYEQAADFTVDVDGKDFEEILDEVVRKMERERTEDDENTCD